MWNTPNGKRILRPNEGRLFLAAANMLKGRIQDSDPLEDFPLLFTELTESQQTAEIEIVTQALLASADVLPATAVHDAAIYSVYHQLKGEIAIEIDLLDTMEWREQTLKTLESVLDPDPEDSDLVPTVAASEDIDAWDFAVEILVDQVLWDRDFQLADSFLDEAPQRAALMRQILGIDEDYFSAPSEDLLN